jgi:hypothetical protein
MREQIGENIEEVPSWLDAILAELELSDEQEQAAQKEPAGSLGFV